MKEIGKFLPPLYFPPLKVVSLTLHLTLSEIAMKNKIILGTKICPPPVVMKQVWKFLPPSERLIELVIDFHWERLIQMLNEKYELQPTFSLPCRLETTCRDETIPEVFANFS